MEPISRSMRIADVIRLYPPAEQVLAHYGMGCAGCMGALDETVEGGARMHSIDVASLLDELNRVVAAGDRD
jgi:hybrid cluster-associated redox disulfide protein